MGLSDELARPLPRIPHPVMPRRRCALADEAALVAAAFGALAPPAEPPGDLLERVAAALGPGGAGLDSLGPREIRAVPFVIWGRDPAWRSDGGFIRRFLARADLLWPQAPRRLWRDYLLSFDPDSPATAELAAWFARRAAALPQAVRAMIAEFRLLDTAAAAGAVAVSALRGDGFADACAANGLNREGLRGSGIVATALAAMGDALAAGAACADAPGRLAALVAGKPENAIAESGCGPALRARAVRAVADGLVAWQLRRGDGGDVRASLDFLLALNGDPRFLPTRWRGAVADSTVAAVEMWLSRMTIEAFFRVIDALRTDSHYMWLARRAFWLRYLPHISKAWLIVGRDAVAPAQREGIPFGRFERGPNVQGDHCGLMLQIRGLCVLEMNKVGSAVFWRAGGARLPGPYEKAYNRSSYLEASHTKAAVAMPHVGNWQQKFRDLIVQQAGVDVP